MGTGMSSRSLRYRLTNGNERPLRRRSSPTYNRDTKMAPSSNTPMTRFQEMCGAQCGCVARNLVLLKRKDLFYTVCEIYKSSGFRVPLAGTANVAMNSFLLGFTGQGNSALCLEQELLHYVFIMLCFPALPFHVSLPSAKRIKGCGCHGREPLSGTLRTRVNHLVIPAPLVKTVFPLDVERFIVTSIREGTLSLTLPWICELLVMMDLVSITMTTPRSALALLNSVYCKLGTLPLRPANRTLLTFKLGHVMELVLVPHGLFSPIPSSTLPPYEPSPVDCLRGIVTPALVMECCPWLPSLRHIMTSSSHDSVVAVTPTKAVVTMVTPSTPVQTKTELTLKENFFHHQPHVVRKVCEFVCERLHGNAVTEMQGVMVTTVTEKLPSPIREWLSVHHTKGSENHSAVSFHISSLASQLISGPTRVEWLECARESCQRDVESLMVALLPPATEPSVVAIATKLTAQKAITKCEVWLGSMGQGFVEREAQKLADSITKTIDKPQDDSDLLSSLSLRPLDQIEKVIETVKTLPDTKGRSALHQRLYNEAIGELCSFIKTNVANLTHLEGVYEALVFLRSCKGVDTTVCISLFQNKNLDCDSTRKRFTNVCLRLLFIGVISTARVEHWLLWLLEQSRDAAIVLSRDIMDKYTKLKVSVRCSDKQFVCPDVAHLLAVYRLCDLLQNRFGTPIYRDARGKGFDSSRVPVKRGPGGNTKEARDSGGLGCRGSVPVRERIVRRTFWLQDWHPKSYQSSDKSS
eukprot:sb/3462375/